MAVTRINNNQISSASAGNVLLGINANTKLQNFSITSNKIANNLTYNSDLTVTGNLTVQGNTTAIDTTITTIEDPVIVLASTQTGAPAVDIGFLGERGTANNIAFVWNEANAQFVTAFTNTSETNTTISIIGYADLRTSNLVVGGTTSLIGNVVGAANFTGNVTGGNLLTAGLISATGTITSAANVIGGNLTTTGQVSATGNGTFGNISTAGSFNVASISASGNITAAGNISAGNSITTGLTQTGTLNTTGNAIVGGNLIVQGNITYININDLRVEDPIIVLGTGPNGAPLSVNDGKDRGVVMEYFVTAGNILGNSFMGWENSSGNMLMASNVSIANDVITVNYYGTFEAGNAYLQSASVIGGVTAASVAGGIITGTSTSVTGTQSAASTVGGVITGSSASVTGTLTGANLALTVGSIDGPAAGRLTVNASDIDTDFAVDGDTAANIFYVDAGTGTASFGTSTQTVNAIVAFNSTTSILTPVGNTAQRPATGVTGMLRFNTTNNAVEVYNNTEWETVGVQTFTLIADEQFNGDGTTVAFTLGSTQTTNSCIVSINGVVQIPTIAYSVSGVDPTCVLTFTEAPAAADLIDVRQLTTTTSVTSIASSSGNAVIATSETAAAVDITGNLVPTANVVFNLGSLTNQWNDLYLAGNSIFLGNTVIKNTGGNTIGFFGPDGTTAATIDAASVDTTTIANGTSSLAVISANGNIRGNVAGSTVINISASLLGVTGNIAATNFITATTGITTGNLNANVTNGGTISGSTLSVTGNITGGNVRVGNILINNDSITSSLTDITIGGFGSTGNVVIAGNLQVLGNTTTINSNNVTTNDLVISVANNAINGAAADGAGLEVGNLASPFITFLYNNSANTWVSSGGISAAGNVLCSIIKADGMENRGANGVGNIGTATTYFNTVFAKATSAQYADLAEKYTADAAYAPGTVVVFGGTAEVTVNAVEGDTKVAGVVSTNPSYIMNSGLTGEHVATVALTGRVPTMVHGPVRKGDLMVAAGLGRAQASADPKVGSVIGKALEDFDGAEGTIEVVVGRF